MKIKAEDLAYWFFRLNGFLTTLNFILHAERKGATGTDVDILGVRFPYRAELFDNTMIDFCEFTKITSCPYIVIAEVKLGKCDLNGPWMSPEKKNFQRVLRAIGIISSENIDSVAQDLYTQGWHMNKNCHISLVCLGKYSNSDILTKYPQVPQILWPDIKRFIYQRFGNYQNEKSWHPNWDENGQNLWNVFKQSNTEEKYISGVEICN